MLLGAHSVGVLDSAAEVEHGKHGDDHHHTLEQQGELKLLSYPEKMQQITFSCRETRDSIPKNTNFSKSNNINNK